MAEAFGHVGQAAGFLTFALFMFMWLYPLRKRVRWLARFGSTPAWLDVHIVAGLLLPVIGATHAAWRFNGLIGLGYASMLAVCLSGLVGRYLYTRIPRTSAGLELGIEEIRLERATPAARPRSTTTVWPVIARSAGSWTTVAVCTRRKAATIVPPVTRITRDEISP